MKIYTKKGDAGETGLLGGTRVPKFHLRIEAYGTVDELNAHLGHLHDLSPDLSQASLLREIQSQLFTIGSHLANDPEKSRFELPKIHEPWIGRLEESIDVMNESLPDLTNFVLPGGHPANSVAHVARCVCRRAERRCTELNLQTPLPEALLPYLNRLSDWLFVLSRSISHSKGAPEILWKASE
ncbi:MAG: cob(I)yrinic acid a,c-diamide adenosyltransferase [Bacteroidota bacterium]